MFFFSQLMITNDLGESYTLLQNFVKAFDWAYISENATTKNLVVQRIEHGNKTVILAINKLSDFARSEVKVLFNDAEEFYVKGDYLFATRKSASTVSVYVCDTNIFYSSILDAMLCSY